MTLLPAVLLQILHVSGLPEGVTREELRALFSTAGEVTKVDIPNGGRNLVSSTDALAAAAVHPICHAADTCITLLVLA